MARPAPVGAQPDVVTRPASCSRPDYTRLSVPDPSGLGREAVCVGGVGHFLTPGQPTLTFKTLWVPFSRTPAACPAALTTEAAERERTGTHRAGDPVYLTCGAYASEPNLLRGLGVPTGRTGDYSYVVHSSPVVPHRHLNEISDVWVRFIERGTRTMRYFPAGTLTETCRYLHACEMELDEVLNEGFTTVLPGRAICERAARRVAAFLGEDWADDWYHTYLSVGVSGGVNSTPCFARGNRHQNEFRYAHWVLDPIDCALTDCRTLDPGPTGSTLPGTTTPPQTTNPPPTSSPPPTSPPPVCPVDTPPGTPGCVPLPPDPCSVAPLPAECIPFDPSGVTFEVVIDHPAQYAAKGSLLEQGASVRSTRLLCDGDVCAPGPGNLDPSKVSLTGRLTLAATRGSYTTCRSVRVTDCAFLPRALDRDRDIRPGDLVSAYFFTPTRSSERVNIRIDTPRGRVQTYRWEPVYQTVEVDCPDGTPGCFDVVFTGEYQRVRDQVIDVPVVVRDVTGRTLPAAGVFLQVIGSIGD